MYATYTPCTSDREDFVVQRYFANYDTGESSFSRPRLAVGATHVVFALPVSTSRILRVRGRLKWVQVADAYTTDEM